MKCLHLCPASSIIWPLKPQELFYANHLIQCYFSVTCLLWDSEHFAHLEFDYVQWMMGDKQKIWLRLTVICDVICAPGIVITELRVWCIYVSIQMQGVHLAPLAVNSLITFIMKSSGGPEGECYFKKYTILWAYTILLPLFLNTLCDLDTLTAMMAIKRCSSTLAFMSWQCYVNDCNAQLDVM